MPKAGQPQAKRRTREAGHPLAGRAATKAEVLAALDLFVRAYQAKHPAAVKCVLKDAEGQGRAAGLPRPAR